MARVLVFVALALAGATFARADVLVPDGFHDELIASGFNTVSNFDFLPDRRVLLVEQKTARILLIDPDRVVPPDTVGIVPDVQVGGSEAGLIGIAVDPRWPAKPYIYVDYSNITSPNLHVTRYALNGDLDGTLGTGLTLDVTSRHDILVDLPDDFPLHNGGTMRFASDNTLWIAVGDDNVPCSAQDLHQLRGKLLRISVLGVPDGPGYAPDYQVLTPPDNPWGGDPDPRLRLVWAYGLRNPWSFDFDRETGAVAIGDVGQDNYEEIDIATAGAQNFGWPYYEGTSIFDYPICTYGDTLAMIPPVWTYPHQGAAAIILAGFVRFDPSATANFPAEYSGNVFYADFYDGRLHRLACANGTCADAPPVAGQPDTTAWATGVSFATHMRFGPDAGLWFATAQGELHRIQPDLVLAADPPRAANALALRAWPVPAAGPMRLSWTMPRAGTASLTITDARGRRVRTLVPEGRVDAGDHLAAWDGADERGARVAPGVYFGALKLGDRVESRRLVVLGTR